MGVPDSRLEEGTLPKNTSDLVLISCWQESNPSGMKAQVEVRKVSLNHTWQTTPCQVKASVLGLSLRRKETLDTGGS